MRGGKIYGAVALLCIIIGTIACSVTYGFSGGSIDYSRIQTIHIADFPNVAPTVYPPLAQKFSEELKHRFQTRTRLTQVGNEGDLNIEGEIFGYDLTAEAVQEDAFAASTRLTMKVRVRYTNNVDEDESFEREFSSYSTFGANQMLADVQDALVEEMVQDIITQIFNATVENW